MGKQKNKSKAKSLDRKQSKQSTKAKDISKAKTKRKGKKSDEPNQQESLQQVQEKIQEKPSPYELQLKQSVYYIKMHDQYEVKQDHKLYKDVKNLFTLFKQKERFIDHKLDKIIPHSNFPTFQFWIRGENPEENKCSICQFQFQNKQNLEEELVKENSDDIIMLNCSHLIHRQCFKMLKGKADWVKCPICSTIYGKMIGDQPDGNMAWNIHQQMHCESYPDVGTIVINYSMNSGKRGNISFPGTHRTAYLPNNKEGNQVLLLLKEAFDRKLIFTLGRSVTTGRDNQIVWNGIHQKTNTSGGSAYFGYPDETYFKRVKLQLAAKGIY